MKLPRRPLHQLLQHSCTSRSVDGFYAGSDLCINLCILDKRYDVLLARRVPLDQIVLGRAYVIHARNGGVGVAVLDEDEGTIGYSLHREKWGEHFLFTEYDWAAGEPFGTAIPLRLLDAEPPKDEEQLLAWLAEREEEHNAEIRAAWKVILGNLLPDG